VIMRLSCFQSNGMVAGVHLAQHKTVIRATAIESSVGEREMRPSVQGISLRLVLGGCTNSERDQN
jgi:hypothetical protein